MKLRIIILAIIIIASSLSIVVASDLNNNFSFDDGSKDNGDSYIPKHHKLHHSAYHDRDSAKNNFTIDGCLQTIT